MATRTIDLDELWDFDDPDGTEVALREHLARLVTPEDDEHILETQTQIARTFSLRRRFDDANALLDEIAASLPESSAARVRWLLEHGRTLNSSGHHAQARAPFVEAWEQARALRLDHLAVDAAHMVAIVSDEADALEWNATALEFAEGSEVPRARRWRGSLHNNIGWTHHGAGRFDLALAHFEAALEARIEQGDDKLTSIARWCEARCLRSLGRIDEALARQEALHAANDGIDEDDPYVAEEMGECLLALGRCDEARPWFQAAHAMLESDPWLKESEPDRLKRLKSLAEGGSG